MRIEKKLRDGGGPPLADAQVKRIKLLIGKMSFCRVLEALAVHDRRAALVILLLRNPHLLESRQRR